MDAGYHALFGTAPWPTWLGNPANSRVSRATVAATGTLRWSLPLPERVADGLSVAADGCCFVTLDHHLLAVEPNGRLRWSRSFGYVSGPALVLADGRLFLFAERSLIVLDQATGVTIISWPLTSYASRSLTPDGDLLYTQFQPSGPPTLQRVSPTGAVRWTHPVAKSSAYPPLVLDDLILFGDESYLRAFSLDGRLQWIANQRGFQPAAGQADLALQVDEGGHFFYTPIIHLGGPAVLGALSWHDGMGFLVFDTQAHTVHLLDTYPSPHEPVVVLPVEGRPHVVTRGFSLKDPSGESRPTVAMLDLHGQERWRRALPLAPASIVADAAGQIIVACSPTVDYWDKYHRWYGLEDQCLVRGLRTDGTELFSWYAPGPIRGGLAIGATGEVFVVAEGTLAAIG